MNRVAIYLVIAVSWLLAMTAPAEADDPVAHLKQFSDFSQLDVPRLLHGDIATQRGALMDFANGISAQLCFAVATLPAETAKKIQTWDESPHESLKVYAFHPIHTPCGSDDFKTLVLSPKQRPVKWLLDKTRATTAGKSDLNLAQAESAAFADCVHGTTDAAVLSGCWAKLLGERMRGFQEHGLAGVLPYEVAGARINPAAQLRALLLDNVTIAHEFAPVLKQLGLMNGHATEPPFCYWSLFDADHHATFNLGAIYRLAVDDHWQLLDAQFYISANLYVAATLYEVWPIRTGDKTVGSLVWRGDYLSAPMLAFTKGTERLAYGALMLQDLKKEVRAFQEDLKTTP